MKKSPFIQGFREPTLTQNSFYLLSDVKGDGEGKLVIWSEDQNQLIVYRGSNRQIQKPTKVKNVSGMIQYYDEQIKAEPAIGLIAENGFYIFRGMIQSFRLKVPEIGPQIQEQMAWSQYNDNPQKLSSQLMNIKNRVLSQKAKYFLSSEDNDQRKQVTHIRIQIIEKVFSQGIRQKDAICAVTVIKETDTSGVGNVVLGTQLNRLYVLDNFGHRIIDQKIINSPPCMLFAYGKFNSKYMIACINRQGVIDIYTQNDKNDPSEIIKLNSRVISADLSYPDFIVITADNILSLYSFSHQNFKLPVPKFSIKLNKKPLKCMIIKFKGLKLSLIAFSDEFRIYNQKQVIYRQQSDKKIISATFGSFAREQNCLILLYEKDGFQVLITHRLFNPKQQYEPKLIKKENNQEKQLVLPKKTSNFLKFWKAQPDDLNSFKSYERSMKLLKWRTLQSKVSDQKSSVSQLQINSKIQGLGPQFSMILQIQNITKDPIFDVSVLIEYNKQAVQIISQYKAKIGMISPLIPISYKLNIKSQNLKTEKLQIYFSWQNNVISQTVCLPACEEMGN